VGSAQLREGAGLLQHGSLLLAGGQTTVREVTRGGAPFDLAVPLADAGGTPDPHVVAEAVAGAAAERWEGAWERTSAEPALLAEASSHEAKFRSPDWTWRV
jgi:hypothetical protein